MHLRSIENIAVFMLSVLCFVKYVVYKMITKIVQMESCMDVLFEPLWSLQKGLMFHTICNMKGDDKET